jgi:RimJ/RimL family protein N-acetyltransferase
VPIDPDRHTDDLFAAGHSGGNPDRLWTYLPYGPFESRDSMRVWLQQCAASPDTWFFAVVDRATDRAFGMCAFLNVVPEMRRLEIGHIWYAPDRQGRGINADACHMLLVEAFEHLRYRRVEWKCDSLNARSRAAALTLGFTFEGVFRQHMIRKGHNRDTAWFSLLDREWAAAKAVLEARLASQSQSV